MGVPCPRGLTKGAAHDLIAEVIESQRQNGTGIARKNLGLIVVGALGALAVFIALLLFAPAPKASTAAPAQHLPTAAEIAKAQQRAIARFPQLGVAGSTMNAAFVARVKQYRVEKPELFNSPEWPVAIAEEMFGARSPAPPPRAAR